MNSTNFNDKCFRILLYLIVCFGLPLHSIAQGLGQFESIVETEANSFRTIAATILDVLCVLGAIGVIYAYVMKRQDARDWLIGYATAIAIYGVIRQTYLTAS